MVIRTLRRLTGVSSSGGNLILLPLLLPGPMTCTLRLNGCRMLCFDIERPQQHRSFGCARNPDEQRTGEQHKVRV